MNHHSAISIVTNSAYIGWVHKFVHTQHPASSSHSPELVYSYLVTLKMDNTMSSSPTGHQSFSNHHFTSTQTQKCYRNVTEAHSNTFLVSAGWLQNFLGLSPTLAMLQISNVQCLWSTHCICPTTAQFQLIVELLVVDEEVTQTAPDVAVMV